MSRHGKDPHTLDSTWVEVTAEKLQSPYISANYRKRLERIYMEAQARIAKSGTVGLHYRRDRQ